MGKSLKQKTVNALIWSATEKFGQQAFFFIISVIIARILMPSDYGLLAMITIFTAISLSFIDSGFNLALIRKIDANQSDFSTIFYFNLSVAVIFYILLFISAPLISEFYQEPKLTALTRFMSLSLIINAFGMIQKTILTKKIDFKTMAKVSIISVILSGIIGIFMAYKGYGVWSLAVKAVSGTLFITILLWVFNSWRPTLEFNYKSFRSMFKFGSRLFIAGLLDKVFNNIYNIIIGKYYSAKDLGYFSKARQLQQMPVNNLMALIGGVSYPVLSTIQDENVRLKNVYKKIIKLTILLNFPLMIGLMIIAKPLIIILLTPKWLPSVIYFQLLCIIGLLVPIAAVNMNILNVKGRSDIFLRLEIVKKTISIIAIIITVSYGILALIIGMIIAAIIGSFLNFYYSGRLINYSVKEQLADITPNLLVSIFMGILVYIIGYFFGDQYLLKLIIQIVSCIGIYYLLIRIFKFEAFYEAKDILNNKILPRIRFRVNNITDYE